MLSPALEAPVRSFSIKKDFKSMNALTCVVDLLKLKFLTDEWHCTSACAFISMNPWPHDVTAPAISCDDTKPDDNILLQLCILKLEVL